MNGIENYPAVGGNFLENVIPKVSQAHFSKDFYPKGGTLIFQGGAAMPSLRGGGGSEVPCKRQLAFSKPFFTCLPVYL